MRDQFLPFAQADFDGTELEEIRQVLESGWVTTGPKTKQFEAEFAAYVGAKQAVAVYSCTAALHLSLEAIGLQPGDEVITSPYTFAATAEVTRYFNARPVFVDVRPDTLNLDPARVEAALTPRTRAIIPVHVAGLPCDLAALGAMARMQRLFMIEDAAHALPAKYQGQRIGSVSDFTCFSFYGTKTLTTGEGGMITTDNERWADRCRIMGLHGISRDAWKRYSSDGTWYYEIVAPGFKYNMTDIAAGMGLAQLRKVERMWQKRVAIARRYTEAFAQVPEVEVPCEGADGQHAWHLYILRLHLDRLTIDRARFIQELKARHIGVSVHFIPLHLHPYYRDTYGYRPEDFPVAYHEYLRAISLPIYSKMTERDSQDVIEAVCQVVEQYRR